MRFPYRAACHASLAARQRKRYPFCLDVSEQLNKRAETTTQWFFVSPSINLDEAFDLIYLACPEEKQILNRFRSCVACPPNAT